MGIGDRVKRFVAQAANIPVSDVHDTMDLAKDIDWSRVHEDEFRYFFENFIQEFNVRLPHADFREYANQKKIPRVLLPFLYVKFRFDQKPLDVDHMTVAELIDIARTGFWRERA